MPRGRLNGCVGSTNKLAVLAAGSVLWAFVIVVPAMHLGLGRLLSTGELLVAAAPLGVLAFGAWGARALVTVVVFPLSLLPLLLVYPELTGPRGYGLGAVLARAGAPVAHQQVAQAPPRPDRHAGRGRGQQAQPAVRSTRLIAVHTAALALIGLIVSCTIVFHRPIQEVIARSHPGAERRATTFIGLVFFVFWVAVVVRRAVEELRVVALADQSTISTQWWRFEANATNEFRSRTALTWALVVGGCALLFLIFVLMT